MLKNETTQNKFLIGYARMLIQDIGDERMAEQPIAGVNHPAWILGHIAFSADRGLEILGDPRQLPQEWQPLFGVDSTLSSKRADYPSKDELIEAVEDTFELFRERASAATEDQLAQPSTNPFTKDALPTLQDSVGFLLTGHLAVHLGQLSTWRRMQGMPRLF